MCELTEDPGESCSYGETGRAGRGRCCLCPLRSRRSSSRRPLCLVPVCVVPHRKGPPPVHGRCCLSMVFLPTRRDDRNRV